MGSYRRSLVRGRGVALAAAVFMLLACVAAVPAAATTTAPSTEAPAGQPTSATRPQALAAQAATLSVAPSTGLVDGQYVTLTVTPQIPVAGLALCEVGASPIGGGECGTATVDGLIGSQGVTTGGSVVVSGARKAYSTAANAAGAAAAVPGPQIVIQLDAAFRDPSGDLIDCRLQPGSRCELVVITYGATDQQAVQPTDGPRATVTFDPDQPLRPPLTMTVAPVDGLQGGQTLNVALHNVKGYGVSVIPCAQALPTGGDPYQYCDTSLVGSVQPDAQGNAYLQIPAPGLIETSDGLVDCRTRTGDDACVLESGDQLTGAITQALTFAEGASLDLPGPRVYFRPLWRPAPSNGWSQMIDLAGFTPASTVSFTWCSPTSCDPDPIATATVQANGTTTGTQLSSPPPPPTSALACAPANPCHVKIDDGHGVATSLPYATYTGVQPGFLSEDRPVSITPDTGLQDGQQVMVSGSGFPPNTLIAFAECTQDVATQGISACDLSTSTFIGGTASTSDGSGIVPPTPFTVKKTLSINGDQVDCGDGNIDPTEYRLLHAAGDPDAVLGRSGYATCLIGVAAITDNYLHSGAQPIAFAGETFRPLVGDAPAHTLGTTPLAAPCDRAAGAPRTVRLAYLRLAGRCPSQQELAWFDTYLRGGGSSAIAVGTIAASPAALTGLVEGEYQRLLHRSADPGGLAFWRSWLASTHRLDLLDANLLASAEFSAQQADGGSQAFVAGLYTTVLGRTGAPSEVAYWTQRLAAGATRGAVALAIIDSPESGRRTVGRTYAALLRRPADPGGVAYWLSVLNPNAQWFTLVGALGSSVEFDQAAQAQPAT
jgi:hypothetical protein